MGVGRVPSTGGHGMVGEVRGGSAFAPHRLDCGLRVCPPPARLRAPPSRQAKADAGGGGGDAGAAKLRSARFVSSRK